MQMALKDKPATPFRVPPGIKLIRVNASTGTARRLGRGRRRDPRGLQARHRRRPTATCRRSDGGGAAGRHAPARRGAAAGRRRRDRRLVLSRLRSRIGVAFRQRKTRARCRRDFVTRRSIACSARRSLLYTHATLRPYDARNHTHGHRRHHARRNRTPRRRDQAVSRAAEEASLTGTMPSAASPN